MRGQLLDPLVLVLFYLVISSCAGAESVTASAPDPSSTAVPTSTSPARPVLSPSSPKASDNLTAPDPSSLREAKAPHGLGNVQLPDHDADIARLFQRLPGEVSGALRSEGFERVVPGEYRATYGSGAGRSCSPISLHARDLSAGDFFPSTWTADLFISFWSLGADWDVEAVGRDGELYWVRWTTTCTGEPSSEESVYAIIWGVAASPWVFSAQAGTQRELDVLVSAFVATTSSEP